MLVYRCFNLENKKCYIGKTKLSLKEIKQQNGTGM